MRVLLADDEKLARMRLTRLLASMPEVELIGVCESGEALLDKLRGAEADVLLLDIEMAGLSGLETSALLPDDGPYVIFVTAHPEHAIAAFEVGAVDYVVKPVEATRLRQALERARSRLQQQADPDKLAVPTRQGVLLLAPAEVSHADYDGCLVTLHLAGQTVVTDLTLAELEQRLPSASFERVHRRHLLNLDHVARLVPLDGGGYTAVTRQGDEVPVSRQAARRLRKRLRI